MSDNPTEGPEGENADWSFTPRGHSEPEDMTPSAAEPVDESNRLLFQMQVTQQPVDFLLKQHGLHPSEDLRLTVALALNNQTSAWLDAIVQRLAASVLRNN